MIKVYKTTIEPYFEYCSLVWDGIDDYLANKLQILQNRAARIITGAPYLTVSNTELFSTLNWLNLKQSRARQKSIMMFKIVNGMAPPYLIDMFSKKTTKSQSLRRSDKDLELPQVRTEQYRKSFAFTGAKLWNSLPKIVKEKQSLGSFKHSLRTVNFSNIT